MDLSFFRRAEQRFASRTPAAPRFRHARRDLALAARVGAGGVGAGGGFGAGERFADPIAEILLAGPGWREAVAAQRGCFNPAYRPARSRQLK